MMGPMYHGGSCALACLSEAPEGTSQSDLSPAAGARRQGPGVGRRVAWAAVLISMSEMTLHVESTFYSP